MPQKSSKYFCYMLLKLTKQQHISFIHSFIHFTYTLKHSNILLGITLYSFSLSIFFTKLKLYEINFTNQYYIIFSAFDKFCLT